MDAENTKNEDRLILVIDDEDMLREVLKEVLDMVGLSALFAGSGKEGIQLFKENRDRIHSDIPTTKRKLTILTYFKRISLFHPC